MEKSIKLVIAILIFTAVGLTVSYIAGGEGKVAHDHSIFFLCALWAYFVNWVAFIPARVFKTEKYYDLTGAFTYITMIGLAVYLSDDLSLRSLVIVALVCLWSLRLGSFLFLRIRRDKGDKRFDDIKENGLRFFLTWTLQATWVVLTSACALAVITASKATSWDIFASLGLILWAIGISFEIIADAQKSAFRKNPANAGRFISTGLWSRSQHPNYFGEILLWIGISVMAIPVLEGWAWLAMISPFFVAFLILRVSGVPLLQKSAKKKWGDDPRYIDYHSKTPILIPRLF
ncbi:steroid 5-alpha reductase family enzyme [Litorimonas taeanensis]|uniref:Steroid 5-alpha reductase family enzyme n=1 Tax=Litorimonas taeanensis TaxID=568099 RepID=A0A420WK32_9PROT|nr:DUF1295 domain-containing protein [Litorimonas taeanensis]RKQ71368.1 steroid 5-alpha reductase family enzyme [Litorimonas taeanensis]